MKNFICYVFGHRWRNDTFYIAREPARNGLATHCVGRTCTRCGATQSNIPSHTGVK